MFEVNDPRYNEIYNTYYDTRHDDNDFLHNVFMKSILNIINSLRTVHNHHLEPFTKTEHHNDCIFFISLFFYLNMYIYYSKGGSFYLQSKIYRSKEDIDQEIRLNEELQK
jgi:hypothetical protein